jgi:hypothetical protein
MEEVISNTLFPFVFDIPETQVEELLQRQLTVLPWSQPLLAKQTWKSAN